VRLHFVVEGQTEETFVRDILAPELATYRIYCDVHRVTTGRKRGKVFRGGVVNYAHLRNDLRLWIKQDSASDSWFTSMIDLYRLPSEFPGYDEARRLLDPYQRVSFLESKFKAEVDYQRFIPYIQLHEFEALLFADPDCFSLAFPEIGDGVTELKTVRDQFATPELIDDGPETSPSKRICQIVPQYSKASAGPLIANHIGLPTLLRECRHFREWIMAVHALREYQS
jgi:hypothetical protein